MPDSTHTWDFTSTFPSTSTSFSKPAPMPMRALSKRRGVHWVQYTPSDPAHAHPDTTPAYPQQLHSDTPFPRKCASDDALRGQRPTPDAQRAVRRKKSSFDLRDLFLTGGTPPGHRAPSASES